MTNQINKHILKAKDNDAAISNTAIKLADDERNVMDKTTIHQRAQLDKAFITVASQHINIITRDGKNIQFKSKSSIATYQQHNETTMLAYDSGADGRYLSEKYRTKLGLPILIISDKKVGVANGVACNGKYITTLPFPQLSNKAAEADTFE